MFNNRDKHTRYELDEWWSHHESMGGYVALCYVDWNIIHSPQNTIVKLLEEFRQLPQSTVEQFSKDTVTNNSMKHRHLLEDTSKIFYLSNELEVNESLMYVPQIIHEPWYDRYRVHPGSGRLAALWLCGYETFRTCYTHFDEPGFEPPGVALKLQSPMDLIMNCRNSAHGFFPHIDIETYYAFPIEEIDCCNTHNMDSEWEYHRVQTMMPWQFIRYSEGFNFLNYKQEWRSSAWSLWWDLQSNTFVLGDTVFEFGRDGTIVEIIRKGKSVNVIDN